MHIYVFGLLGFVVLIDLLWWFADLRVRFQRKKGQKFEGENWEFRVGIYVLQSIKVG